jgi:hypothetical protein
VRATANVQSVVEVAALIFSKLPWRNHCGSNVTDVNFAAVVVHGSYQARMISRDIENGEFADFVGVRENGSHGLDV